MQSLRQRSDIARQAGYRTWLVAATLILIRVVSWFQSRESLSLHPSHLQTALRWGELAWLPPLPFALLMWFGWFVFAEAVRPDPTPALAPTLAPSGPGRGRAEGSVALVFRIVTRGDNVEALTTSVAAIHRAFAMYPERCGPYRI